MQHECLPDGARSRYERRKPTKVLKIAESFTNLDETAKAGRYVRGPHSKFGRRFRETQENGARTRRAVCCDDDDCDKESSVSEESERHGDRRVTGSSCTALRTAVAALYPFDDFILEKVGTGFFSEVFKVSDIVYLCLRMHYSIIMCTILEKTTMYLFAHYLIGFQQSYSLIQYDVPSKIL